MRSYVLYLESQEALESLVADLQEKGESRGWVAFDDDGEPIGLDIGRGEHEDGEREQEVIAE